MITVSGLLLTLVVIYLGLHSKEYQQNNIFYVLYAFYEPGQLLLVLLALPVLYLGVSWKKKMLPGGNLLEGILARRGTLVVVTLTVLCLCWAGRVGVYRQINFSQDEYAMDFQAQIFAEGQLKAPVPAEWQPLAEAMTPIFITYERETGSWMASYLPIYALLLAPFHKLGLASLLNPLLAAFTLLALAAVVREMWPARPAAPVFAALLLAASPQFLVTAMSGYTMTAHLLFNLIWLYLYVRGSRWSLLALPWVGFLAMGLHAFVPHALFVIPFLLRMVATRRFKLSAYVAAMYLLASAVWIYWLQVVNPTIGSVSAARFGIPGWRQCLSQGMSLALLVSWQALPLAVLTTIGFLQLRRGNALLRDIALSCAFTFGFYFLFFHDQGHGWGNRYFHPALGNLVILAVFGWQRLITRTERRAALGFVMTGLCLALLVQLPLRLLQVHGFMTPFARGLAHIEAVEQTVVVVPATAIWYGQDLVRNGPFLDDGPKRFFFRRLNEAGLRELQQRGSVYFMPPPELETLGLTLRRRPGA